MPWKYSVAVSWTVVPLDRMSRTSLGMGILGAGMGVVDQLKASRSRNKEVGKREGTAEGDQRGEGGLGGRGGRISGLMCMVGGDGCLGGGGC